MQIHGEILVKEWFLWPESPISLSNEIQPTLRRRHKVSYSVPLVGFWLLRDVYARSPWQPCSSSTLLCHVKFTNRVKFLDFSIITPSQSVAFHLSICKCQGDTLWRLHKRQESHHVGMLDNLSLNQSINHLRCHCDGFHFIGPHLMVILSTVDENASSFVPSFDLGFTASHIMI